MGRCGPANDSGPIMRLKSKIMNNNIGPSSWQPNNTNAFYFPLSILHFFLQPKHGFTTEHKAASAEAVALVTGSFLSASG